MTERYISLFPKPTAYQQELLEILIEECAEVQQRATKLLRFGAEESQPGQPLTNKERLSREIGDLYVMLELAEDAGLVDQLQVTVGMESKLDQLKKYMQTTTKDSIAQETKCACGGGCDCKKEH